MNLPVIYRYLISVLAVTALILGLANREIIINMVGSPKPKYTTENKISGSDVQETGLLQLQALSRIITVNKGEKDEFSFEVIQYLRGNQVVSVEPKVEGGAYNFTVASSKLAFTDQGNKGLWIADIDTLNPINLQPKTVNGISQQELFEKRDQLERQGKDMDNNVLFWAHWPIWSPDEDKIAFVSNRTSYPEAAGVGIWVTDLHGNTEMLVSPERFGSLKPLAWLNKTELIFLTENHDICKVNTDNHEVSNILSRVGFESASPDGAVLIYHPFDHNGLIIQTEVRAYRVLDGTDVVINIPDGFKPDTGQYRWDKTNRKVAFLVRNDQLAESKLVVFDTIETTTQIFAPYLDINVILDSVDKEEENLRTRPN